MTTRLITCLPAVVGAWGKKGGGILTSAGASKAYHKDIVTRSDWKKKGTRLVNMCCIGQALTEDDSIQSLFVYSSNPACTAPDQNKVLAGLSRDDLFTVVHERFMTDTARYADIVLPATTSLEHDDAYYPTAITRYSAAMPSSDLSAKVDLIGASPVIWPSSRHYRSLLRPVRTGPCR